MQLTDHKTHTLTENEKIFFIQNGYLVIPEAIDSNLVLELQQECQKLFDASAGQYVNTADVISQGGPYLKLATLPTILPRVTGLLGWNIWINHSHTNIHTPNQYEPDGSFDYGWHRDGGAIENDLPDETPWFGIKVGFYVTSTEKENTGTTICIPGSHKDNRPLPADNYIPPDAVAISAPKGAAVLMHPRIIHSIRSPNLTDNLREVIFIQWAYRWLQPVDANTTSQLSPQITDPYEMQLLGLSTNTSALNEKYASGRSGWYYPGDNEVPLRHYVTQLYGSPDKTEFVLG